MPASTSAHSRPDADQEAADVLERLLRRREADALDRRPASASSRSSESARWLPRLSPQHGVDLVHDDGRDGAEHPPPAVARQQQVERLGRRDEDVRRPLRHRGALARRRVAGAHEHAHLGNRRVQRRDLGERPLQVLLHVVGERAQRRDVEDLRLVGQARALPDQAVDRREKRRERLARSRRRRDQRVAALPDDRPALALRRRRLPEPLREPGPDGRMEVRSRVIGVNINRAPSASLPAPTAAIRAAGSCRRPPRARTAGEPGGRTKGGLLRPRARPPSGATRRHCTSR